MSRAVRLSGFPGPRQGAGTPPSGRPEPISAMFPSFNARAPSASSLQTSRSPPRRLRRGRPPRPRPRRGAAFGRDPPTDGRPRPRRRSIPDAGLLAGRRGHFPPRPRGTCPVCSTSPPPSDSAARRPGSCQRSPTPSPTSISRRPARRRSPSISSGSPRSPRPSHPAESGWASKPSAWQGSARGGRRYSSRELGDLGPVLDPLAASYPGVGLLLDTFHLYASGEPLEAALASGAGSIAWVHVADLPRGASGRPETHGRSRAGAARREHGLRSTTAASWRSSAIEAMPEPGHGRAPGTVPLARRTQPGQTAAAVARSLARSGPRGRSGDTRLDFGRPLRHGGDLVAEDPNLRGRSIPSRT